MRIEKSNINVKDMEDGILLQAYVEAMHDYEADPTNKEIKFKVIDMNLEILKRMAK